MAKSERGTWKSKPKRFHEFMSSANASCVPFLKKPVLSRLAAGFGLAMVLASLALAKSALGEPPTDRTREIERQIDGLASHNEAPKLFGDTPIFSENFDWGDRKRVEAIAWALSQDDSNDLWGHLVAHFHDARYSATIRTSDGEPQDFDVGNVCRIIAGHKLRCAYLMHLEPGKTAPYGVNSPNWVSEQTKDFLPGSIQSDLHWNMPPELTPRRLTEWYEARATKPFYELQIEVCEWAIKRVHDAHGAADKPKREFIATVRKQIESLRKSKRPVIDPSSWASPLTPPWQSYSPDDAKQDRERYLEELRKEKRTHS
jgi:hypothetical protein